MNKEELLNKIINYNYTEFGNEFGDYLVDIKNENQELKDRIDKAVEYIEEHSVDTYNEDGWSMFEKCTPLQVIKILKGDKE